uniref:uncharacterized protein LOC120347050 isoform X1 n=2 Tax=Styela clava TaxID=7725 RepID=UPI0019397282|nr:uncharacterized protein LOC120347050 isoform X1 [Styela clava]
MSYCGNMTSLKPRRKIENEFLFERLRKIFCRVFGGLVLEITENYKRVGRILTSVWILCSSYICSLQYTIQGLLGTVEKDLKCCCSNIIYEPSIFHKVWQRLSASTAEEKLLSTQHCMCNKGLTSFQLIQTTRDAKLVTSWLRTKGMQVSFSDVAVWNDGTLMWEVLKRVSRRKDEDFKELQAEKRIENWSLLGAVIKRQFPGLIENELIFRCLIASDPVRIHHLVYILTRIMHARRRMWKVMTLKWLLWISDALKRILQPRFIVSGPGISHTKINVKNEFSIRTLYDCPPFTVDVEDDNGEIWRETSNNAKLSSSHDDEYQTAVYPGLLDNQTPVEIIKVSRFLYRVFYIVHTKGICKVSIRPGINRGGQIYGSPFKVNVASGTYRKQHKLEKSHSEPRPFVLTPHIRKHSIVENKGRSRRESMPDQPKENVKTFTMPNSNGNVIHEDDELLDLEEKNDVVTPIENQTINTVPEPRIGIRKMTAQIIRNIGSGISIVSSRVFSTMSRRGHGSSVSRVPTAKRRTHASVYVGTNMNGVGGAANELSVPSSRNFKIRRVTIHRYLNKPMPSLEEYFFGSTGIIFDNDESSGPRDAGKRWGNISSLLRAKMRMTTSSSRYVKEETKHLSDKTKEWEVSPDARKRRARLRRSENVYQKPKLRSRHSSDDLFWRRSTIDDSSSSSESYDVFDDVIAEEPASFTRTLHAAQEINEAMNIENTVRPKKESSRNGVRFQHIFSEEDGAADLFLQNTPSHKQEDRTRSSLRRKIAETPKPTPNISRNSSTNSTDSPRATRRTGYANFQMTNADATEQIKTNNKTDLYAKPTILTFANEAADKLIEMAKKEVVVSTPKTSS